MIFNEVGEGQLNSILVRRLSMKVPTAAPSVAPELFPNITLENDRPEWGFLKGEYAYGRLFSSPAVAAQLSWASLQNPADSGLIVVVHRMVCTAQAVMHIGFQSPTTLSSSNAGVTRDTRQRSVSRSFVGVGANATTPAGFSINGVLVASVVTDEPVVLAPGSWLLLQGTILNSAITGEFAWTERPAVTGELG